MDQIHSLAKMYSDFENVPDVAYVANTAEIAGNDYSLAINRYVTHDQIDQELVPSEDLLSEWISGLGSMRMAIQDVVDALGGDQKMCIRDSRSTSWQLSIVSVGS